MSPPRKGLTTLRVTVPDQAALHGVIERIRALGLELGRRADGGR